MAGFMKHKFGERGHRVWRIILEHKYLQVRGALQCLGVHAQLRRPRLQASSTGSWHTETVVL